MEQLPNNQPEQLDQAAQQAHDEEAQKAFYIEVGRLSEENPDRPDLVQQELGLTPAKLREAGATRLSDLVAAAAPTYAAYKAEKDAADKEAAQQARQKQFADEFEASVASNKAAAEARKAKKSAEETDELVASLTTNELAGVSATELSELTGKSYADILRDGKHTVVKDATQRIQERTDKATAEKTRTVPTNTAAEQRNSELGQMLKSFDRQVGAAHLDRADNPVTAPEENSEPTTPDEAELGNPTYPVAAPITAEHPYPTTAGTDLLRALDGREVLTVTDEDTNLPQTETVPVALGEEVADQPEKVGRLQRMKSYLRDINATIGVKAAMNMNKAKEWFSSLDRDSKIKVIGGAAVAVAAAGTAYYFANKYSLGGGGGSGSQTLEAINDADQNRPRNTGALDAINEAVQNRTNDILNTDGSHPWNRAQELYGNGAGAKPRLEHAVEVLQQQGVDAGWVGDYIQIDGHSDTEYVWNKLAQVLAEEDIRKFLEASNQAA